MKRAHADPYIAGCALGIVLLGSFVVTGQGLGASGAFANVATGLVEALAPAQLAVNDYFASYAHSGAPWTAWMVIEVLGIVIGGALSAALSGRFRIEVNSAATIGNETRLASAVVGGALMGVGAVLARGCTSGQALSGGAMLSVGSWTFMVTAFAGGFIVAPFVRRLWR